MKRISMLLMLLLVMTMGSHRVCAQSVTVTLMPGWNWISNPTMDTLDFTAALGSFTPAVGDIIQSQWGSSSYLGNGQWRGNASHFYPGYGYMYKSNRAMPVFLTFTAQQPAPQVIVTTVEPTDITSNSARSPEFAIREARISAFAMRKHDMRLPWYDSPTAQRWGCRAITVWQPHN